MSAPRSRDRAYRAFERSRTARPSRPGCARCAEALSASRAGFPTTRDEDWRYTQRRRRSRATAFAPAPRRGAAFAEDALCRRLRTPRRPSWCSSTAASTPERSSVGAADGVRISRAWLRRSMPSAPMQSAARSARSRPTPFAALNTAFRRGRRRHRWWRRGAVLARPIHIVHARERRRGAHAPATRACSFRWAPAAARPSSRATAAPTAQALLDERGHRGRARRRAPRSTTTRCSARATRAFHTASHRGAPGTRRALRRRIIHAGRRPQPRRHRDQSSTARAPSATLERPVRGRPATSTSTPTPASTTRPPHCTSRELYKGILDGQARGVFHGRILVRPGAQKTDAQQTNKNLLLSRERAREQHAAARDPGRRREVQARLDHRPARPRGALLPALARHRRGGGAARC